ncbi:putative GTP-ase activating protein [Aphelenchoides bicaudatus]|nr:putative GTP-ase activating protein [Aphelenchoides bicaudatus]
MRNSGATSQRKKVEEQHAQIIRQLLTKEENKYCFECGQRGLHPPHRVKSISMSTFTAEEVERLKTLGNAVNSKIYLGLYDGKKKFEPRIDDEVRAHLVEKYENRRWCVILNMYVSPSDLERQKQLLEEHAANRRDSWSATSQKSNQSAPPNLHPPQSARSGPIDLLTGDLFDLSLSSTPVQQSVPTIAQQPQTDLKSPQDDWADLFTKPVSIAEPTLHPLSTSTVPAALKFPMPIIPPPKSKEHSVLTSSASNSQTSHQQWESFGSTIPKSVTVGGINAPASDNKFEDLFSNFTANQHNGEHKPQQAETTTNQANFDFGLDAFGSTKTTQNTGAQNNWNPFLS